MIRLIAGLSLAVAVAFSPVTFAMQAQHNTAKGTTTNYNSNHKENHSLHKNQVMKSKTPKGTTAVCLGFFCF